MTSHDDNAPERFSLKRWSARKLDAARRTPAPAEIPVPHVTQPSAVVVNPPANEPKPLGDAPPVLPPVDALTFESDFSAFLNPKVAEPLKRQALKKLFSDPRFNVMDGLDVYIDDYSVPSPLEPELVTKLAHATFTLDPPRTRVNARGFVEDVPPEELAAPSAAQPAVEQIATSDAPSSSLVSDAVPAREADPQ